MGEKAESRHGKQGKKEKGKLGGKEQVQKRPGSVHSLSRPPAQWETGSRKHHSASGSAPGHWLIRGRPETKGVPTVPPVHKLLSIPTNWSLNKQLFGKFKQNELQRQN